MDFSKDTIKKALNFSLLFYAIFLAIGFTVCLAILIIFFLPKEEISNAIFPITLLSIFAYGSCIVALIIRLILKRKNIL